MFTVKSVHIALEFWGLIFCLIAAFCIGLSRGMEEKKRRIMFLLQLATALLLLMDALAWWFRGYPGDTGYVMVRISNFIVFLMNDVILLLFHSYECKCLFQGEHENEMKSLKRVKVVYGICAVAIFMVIVSQFTDLYYYFDSDNFYHRNTWYPLTLVFGQVGVFIDLSLLIQYRHRISRSLFLSLLSYVVLPDIAVGILFFYYGASLINIAICISMIFMFIVVMAQQSRKLEQKDKELHELQIEMMLSQIKPHFVYNTLTTIKHLYRMDQEVAEETLDDFARYLRASIDTLSVTEMISFEKELNFTKSFLSIEQKRFGDRIRVEYEIEAMDFLIPPMTLQPIVENAVRHGIAKKIEGGTIRIGTRCVENEIIVSVKDDGVGFDSQKEDWENGESHIGIRNVRSRVESMCHGDVLVSSLPGKGTLVQIVLKKD